MTRGISVEWMFVEEYRRILDEKLTSLKEHTSTNALPQEEYLVNVGTIRALTDTKAEFEHLLKKYFSRNS